MTKTRTKTNKATALLVLLAIVLLIAPASATASTAVTVTKYDPYGTVLGTQTITWEEMKDTLPVCGDGVTHYYMHGPTFDDSSFDALWDPIEIVNIDTRDYGAAMGTDVKDLCELAGGAGSDDTIQIKANDNFNKWFDYEDVYNPEPEQGKMVVTWYTSGSAEGDTGYVNESYGDGMRLIFFAETLNPEGKNVFGDWDMHETLPASRWHYYYGGGFWPSSSGLSVKYVSNINIYQPSLISCDAAGDPVDGFAPGETVYVKGMGLDADTSYNIWVQGEPVLLLPLNDLDRPTPGVYYSFSTGNDPSGAQESVTTDSNGDFTPIAVWTIDPSAAEGEYDIVADNQALGTVGTYDSRDYIDNPGWKGFTVTTTPVPPVAAFTSNVTSGDAPLTIQFTDQSTGDEITDWAWDFENDGTVDSTEQNPVHEYTNDGVYTVNLTVLNASGSDVEVKTDYITVSSATASTWYVDDDGGADFTTIQAAVNAAAEGDTVIVKDGSYTENVIVGKSLTIQSENGAAAVTVTAANANSDAFQVTPANVTISGLTITGATGYQMAGIHIKYTTSGCTISDNDCSGNDRGIFLDVSSGNTIENNVCNNGWAGIYILAGSGNTVTGNNCSNNDGLGGGTGIYVSDDSSGNTISGNTCNNNLQRGIYLKYSSGNTITENTCTGNADGIYLKSNSLNNVIYANNFQDNTLNVNCVDSPNTWTSPEAVDYTYGSTAYLAPVGNFYSDYSGADADGNGIGDTPVTIVGTDQDTAPLMGEWHDGVITSPAQQPTANFTSDVTSGAAPLTVQFTDQSTGSPTAWAWDFENDGTVDSTVQNPVHEYTTASTYTVKLTVINSAGSDEEVKTDYITLTEPALLPVLNVNTGLRYATIQAAVTAATTGEEIVVSDGTYIENVLVDRALTIRGENGTAAVSVTAASSKLPVFDIDADSVTIEGFTVRGPTDTHVAGIEIVGFDNCLITANDCAGCYNGIHIGGDGTNNTVTDNYCHDNTQRGVSIRDAAYGNYITGNTVENNADAGICIKDTAHDNVLWLNAVIGDSLEIMTVNTANSPEPITYTYNGGIYTGYLGNYYSTYTGTDADGDGVGATAFSSGSYYADNYPLVALPSEYVETVLFVWGPYLTGTTTTGTIVNVKTPEAATVTVEYADDKYYTANGGYDRSATAEAGAELHHVELNGLSPDMLYHYRVVRSGVTTGDLHFRTLPESSTFSFVAYGDSQDQLPQFSQEERHKLVADRIATEEDVAFVLHSGDLVNDATLTTDWDRFFLAGGAMLANVTIFPALGNHEQNATLYYEIFGMPEYYSFDAGNAHFTLLDSNDWASPNMEEQTTWLTADLATPADWNFVTFHHPAYTSEESHWGGYANIREEWEDIFIANGVDVVTNGEVHAYERYLENGITYMVLGIGGGPCYPLAEEKIEGYQNSLENTLGYAKVTVDPAAGTATVEIKPVAEIASDGSGVSYIYPEGSVYETFVLELSGAPKTWYVDDDGDADFTTIQAAVDAATDGDTIVVKDGTYTERIVVDRGLTIVSENGRDTTIVIAPDGDGNIFSIYANKTTIDGFTVMNAGAMYSGIYLDDTNYCTIINNNISSSWFGVRLVSSDYNIIDNNIASNNKRWGIDLEGSHYNSIYGNTADSSNVEDGIGLTSSHNNIVTENFAAFNSKAGILLSYSHNNLLDNNTVDSNTIYGLRLQSASYNTVTNNTASRTSYGIIVEFSQGNEIYLNNFMDNTDDVYVALGDTNTWNTTVPLQYAYGGTTFSNYLGNYYTDYAGADADLNGIGDVPATFSDINVDTAPLMGEWHDGVIESSAQPPTANFTSDVTTGNAPLTVQFTDLSTGEGITDWAWDFENDGIVDSNEQNPNHIYTTAGIYTIKLTVTGPGGSDELVMLDYITVSSAPVMNVLYKGTVNLEEGTTFDWIADDGTVATVDTITPHGALDAAATDAEFMYGGSWKSFKNTALLDWIEADGVNYTFDEGIGYTWNYQLNGVYQDYFSDITGISNNVLQDGDYIEFYYGPDEEVTDNATAVVRITVSTTPVSTVDVLYDGQVTLTPGVTFDVTAYNSEVTYTVNEKTPLGALDKAAIAGGFTYEVTDSRWNYDLVLLLDNVDVYAYKDPGKWYTYVNDVYKDGYMNTAAGLNVIELAEGDTVEFYYAVDVVDETDLTEVQGKATAAVKTVVALPLPYDILYDDTAILEEGTTFDWTADDASVWTVDTMTPHGALEAAVADGGFTYGGSWKGSKNTALLDWIEVDGVTYAYNDTVGLTWNYLLNGVHQDYFSDVTGISNNAIQNGDCIEFYYGPDEESLDNATVVIRITVSNGQVPDDWTLELSGAMDETVSKAYFEDGLACPSSGHYVEWTDDDGKVWGGVPLWLLVGMVDDDPDEGPYHFNFNEDIAAQDYEIKVIASDGWFTILSSTDIARNDGYIVANTLNGSALPYDGDKPSWPLHLKGLNVSGGQQVGGIVRIELSGLPEPPEGWTLELVGEVGDTITQSEFEEGIACESSGHLVTWTDGSSNTWSGVPLWVLLGAVDDIELASHWTFSDDAAASNYTINVIAEDGWTRTFYSDDVARNDDYIVTNMMNGTELDAENGYPLKLNGPAITSGKDRVGNIATIEILELQTPPAEPGSWNLNLSGKITDLISEAEFQAALDCPSSGHYVEWTDNDGNLWSGLPLWFLCGWVDDRIPHEFSATQASAGYTVTVKAGDGYSYSFSSADVACSSDYIVANKINGTLLNDSWPLRLVGDGVTRADGTLGGMSIGEIAEIELTEFSEPTEIPRLHIVKYGADQQTIIAEAWIDYTEMITQFDVIGDGETVYHYQGVTMDPEDIWGVDDQTKGGFKISNAVKGTRVVDLVSLVGGMGEGTDIVFVADDGYKTILPYTSIYTTPDIQERQGDAVLAWYADGSYVPGYSEGMRLFFMPEDTIIGQWDMHESMPAGYWHYYYQTYDPQDPLYGQYAPGILYPSVAGTSAKYVTEIAVYSSPESDWNLQLDGTRVGGLNYTVNKAYFEAALACQFGANHDASYDDGNGKVWTGMPLYFLQGFVDDADQHSDEAYNQILAEAGYDIIVMAPDGYNKVFNSQDTIRSTGYIVANMLNGYTIPESDSSWPLRLVGENVSKSDNVKGIRDIILNFRPNITAIDTPDTVIVDEEVTLTAFFTDPYDTHTAAIDWGDGGSSDGSMDEEAGNTTGSHTYTTAGTYTVNVTVTDSMVASDMKSTTITVNDAEIPSTPYEKTEALQEYIIGQNLPNGTKNALLSKLSAAMKFMGEDTGVEESRTLADDDNSNKPKTAINILEAFINFVEAQDSKKIPHDTAIYLIGEAEGIIASLTEDTMSNGSVIAEQKEEAESDTVADQSEAEDEDKGKNDDKAEKNNDDAGKKDDDTVNNDDKAEKNNDDTGKKDDDTVNNNDNAGSNGKHLGQMKNN